MIIGDLKKEFKYLKTMNIKENNNESNKCIAEFMGYKYIQPQDSSDTWGWYLNGDNNYKFNYLGKLKYHNSWDALMSVLVKIESLGYSWVIGCSIESPYHYCEIFGFELPIEGISPIDATYGAVVEFITWYNSKKATFKPNI